MSSLVLTPELLEEAHTAAEYLQWVRTLISRVKEAPDGLEQIRLRKGLAKELMNEALPIGLLASTYFGGSEQVSISLKIGNQSYDATVSDCRKNGSSVNHVEVTLASDGDNDYLRMLALHQTGEVSGLGSVKKSGTRRTGLTIRVEREMASHAEVLRQESDRLSHAIVRKLDKTYPRNTLLLIGMDDTMAFDRPDNVANLKATVETCLPRLRGFHSVAVVGLQQGMLLSWDTKSAI